MTDVDLSNSQSLLTAILKEITDYNARLKAIEDKLNYIESDLKSLKGDIKNHIDWHAENDKKGFFRSLFRGGG